MEVQLITSLHGIEHEIPVFASEAYLKNCSTQYAWLLSDACLLPLVVHKRYIFKYVTFTSDVVYLKGGVTEQTETAFLHAAVQTLKKHGIDFITTPQSNALFRCVPQRAKWCRFGSYRIDLQKSEDALFEAVHTKHRNSIRKATKDGVTVSFGNHLLHEVFTVIADTQQRNGIFFHTELEFKQLVQSLGSNVMLCAAYYQGKCQGTAFVIKDSTTAYYLYGGSCDAPHTGSLNLLQWEIILQLKQSGTMFYDFVGARVSPSETSRAYGIKRFKQRFGGDFLQGYLWKYDINPLKKKLFDVLIRVKTGKLNHDIIDEESINN